jgi:hypothetical protein
LLCSQQIAPALATLRQGINAPQCASGNLAAGTSSRELEPISALSR